MKILIVNGPNLNLLGKREPEIYGNETLSDIELWLSKKSEAKNHEILWFQSNHEGEIIDKIHGAIDIFDGIIINPGAFTHYSYAIRDAISAVNIPTVEVHLSDTKSREDFRKVSVTKDVCVKQISGKGIDVYLEGVHFLNNLPTL